MVFMLCMLATALLIMGEYFRSLLNDVNILPPRNPKLQVFCKNFVLVFNSFFHYFFLDDR